MCKLPTPDVSRQFNHLCLIKVAVDHLVHGYLPDHASERGSVGSQFTALSRYFRECSFESQAQASHVMKQTDGLILLKGVVVMDDVYWDGKRDREPLGRHHSSLRYLVTKKADRAT